MLDATAKPAGDPETPVAPSRVRPRWRWALVGLGTAATIAVWALVASRKGGLGGGSASGGQLSASTRRTLHIGDRATAVLESGSELAWSHTGDGSRVQQIKGAVFYRVDPGKGTFHVATPVGEAEVTGTCFQVELGPASSEMLVRVFECVVRVRNGRGEIPVTAGDRARVLADGAPRLLPTFDPRGTTDDRPRQPAADAERRAVAAEDRIRSLEQALAEAQERNGGTDGGPGYPPRGKCFGFTAEEKRALAERCEFRYGLPRHLATLDLLEVDESFGLSPDERASVLRVMDEQRNQFVEQLRFIYRQVAGEAPGVAMLSPLALQNEISIKSRRGEDQEARRHIYDEWAGRVSPQRNFAARPPVEHFWRLVSTGADEFVSRLKPFLGEKRSNDIAHKLMKSTVQITDKDQCTPRR